MEAAVTARLKRARILYEQERYELTEQELRPVLTRDVRHEEALSLLIRCKYHRRQYDEALELTADYLAACPQQDYFLYLRALVLRKLFQYEEAEKCLLTALSLEPRRVSCYELMGWIHCERGDYEKALRYAQQGLQQNPVHEGCLSVQTVVLAALHRTEQSQASRRTLLGQAPDEWRAHHNVGLALHVQGDYTGAVRHFEEVLRLNPQALETQQHLLRALRRRLRAYGLLLRVLRGGNENARSGDSRGLSLVYIKLLLLVLASYWAGFSFAAFTFGAGFCLLVQLDVSLGMLFGLPAYFPARHRPLLPTSAQIGAYEAGSLLAVTAGSILLWMTTAGALALVVALISFLAALNAYNETIPAF